MRTELSRTATRVLLVIVLVVGAALRFAALSYGLPFVYNPDEVAIMNRALAFATNGLNPHNFLYPTLYFYVLFAWEVARLRRRSRLRRLRLARRVRASVLRRSDLDFSRWPEADRALRCCDDCRDLRARPAAVGRAAGVIAAAVLAVSPIAVRDAHYVKHDVPVTLLIVLTILALVRPRRGAERPDRRPR